MTAEARDGECVFTIRPSSPLDFHLTLQRYRRWGEDPANVYRGGAFYRVAWVAGRAVPFRLTATGPRSRPVVTVAFVGANAPAHRAVLGTEARQLLGLDADLVGFYTRAVSDPVLAPLVRRFYGLRLSLTPNPFEMLVGAITAQQVNLVFALTTRARLVHRFGTSTTLNGVTVHAFPSPATMAGTDVGTLRAMQLSTQKATSIIGLSQAVVEGQLDLVALRLAHDEEVISRLTRMRGLGRWTAEWFLARGLGRSDVCPAEDLGVRRAVEAVCFGGRPADAARVRRQARVWRPYRSLAVAYLLAERYGRGVPGTDVR